MQNDQLDFTVTWQQAPNSFSLSSDHEIQIWKLAVETHYRAVDFYYQLLDCEEKYRAARFRVALARREFILAHGGLRYLLGHYLRVPPTAIKLQKNPAGKLSLTDAPLPLHFNLTHSHGVILIAFSRHFSLGIDLEQLDENCPILELSQHFFAPEEYQHLAQLPQEQRLHNFFYTWVSKEALTKALGATLAQTMRHFILTEQLPSNTFCCYNPPRLAESPLIIKNFIPEPNYVGALAVATPSLLPLQLRWWTLPI